MNKEEIINILTINLGMTDYIDVTKYLSDLEEENKKYKEVIDKVKVYIEELNKVMPRYWFNKLLDILKEVNQ